MSSPDVKKASRDPKTIYEACAVAARQSRGKDIEGKTSSCANEVMGSPYFPDLASARTNVSCMDGYKGADAQGKCLADAMWPAPKAKAYVTPGIPLVYGFENINIHAFKDSSNYITFGPIGKSSEEEKPNVIFRVNFPFGPEESYGYTWFKKDGRELTLEDAQKINRGLFVSSEIYFNCQQGTPYNVGSFISRGGSCEKPFADISARGRFCMDFQELNTRACSRVFDVAPPLPFGGSFKLFNF